MMISDDTIILDFGDKYPPLRLRHLYEGTIIYGATGSGKTSGSAYALASGFLKAGLGGLVLVAKPQETIRWRKLAQFFGRGTDLRVISPDTKYRFNFLRYEQQRPGRGAGMTENIVSVFYEAMQAFGRGKGDGGHDPYWQAASRAMLSNATDLFLLAGEPLSLNRIRKLILTAPSFSSEFGAMDEAERKARLLGSKYAGLFDKAINRELTPRQKKDLKITDDYWMDDFGMLSEKTRSSIISVFTSMADGLMRGELAELFSTTCNIFPEDSRKGKIIILDIDLMNYGPLGKIAQVIFKTVWQRAMERYPGNPCFLFCDESQFFHNERDILFQSTAREFKTCSVYITQNIPGYALELGSNHNAQDQISALMGNLRNKFFHANDCPKTNTFAADLIGKRWDSRTNPSGGSNDDPTTGQAKNQSGWSTQQSRQHRCYPENFMHLKTGGPDFDRKTEAIFFRAPDWRKITFTQPEEKF